MGLVGRLQRSFVAGVLLVAPLAVTVFVLQFAFVRVTRAMNPLVAATGLAGYVGNDQLLAQVVAAVLLAAGIVVVGDLASRQVGRRLFGSLERGVRLVPLVRTIYFGVRQVSESLLERAAGYDRVVLVRYPREGSFVIGFVTNRGPPAAREASDERLYTVFLPNSPNPTAGQLLLVEESELVDLDVSVRHGLRLLITTGLSIDAVEEELPEADGADDGERPDPDTAT